MKKFLAAMLSLCIMLGINVNAYADEGEYLVLTETIPDRSFTLTIPKGTIALEYGNTGLQDIGEMCVSDVIGYSSILVAPFYGDLLNENDTVDKLVLELYYGDDSDHAWLLNFDGQDVEYNQQVILYAWEMFFNPHLFAKVPDWSDATFGAKYNRTVTFATFIDY